MPAIIDDFEDGSLTEYVTFASANGTPTVTSSVSHEGSQSMYLEASGSSDAGAYSTGGLNAYPTQGETMTVWVRFGDTSGGGEIRFGGPGPDNCYLIDFNLHNTELRLRRRSSGSNTTLDASSYSFNTNQWYEVEFPWGTNGDIDVTVYESGSQVASVFGNDSTFNTDGFGASRWVASGSSTMWVDYATYLQESAPPSNVAVSISGDDATVTWNDDSTVEDGFHIDRNRDGTGWTRVASVGADVTEYTDSNLLDGERYRYRVRSYTADSSSDWVYSDYATTDLPAPSGATQTVDSPTAITVSFSDNSDNENQFRVEKRVDGGAWTHAGDVSANTTSQQFTVSKSADTFRWRVRAETEDTTSGWTYTSTVATDGSGLTATVVSGTQVDLAWDAEQDVDEYHLYRAQASSSSLGDYTQIATIAAGTTTHSDTGRENGEEYHYRVAPVYGGAEDDPSADVPATTDLPAGSNVTPDTSVEDEISLDWTREDNSPDGNWEILRSTDGSTGSIIATITDVTQTTYTDTGRADGERYDYTVRRNTDHASADSTQQSAIAALPAPTTLQSPSHGFATIDITWTDNHDNGQTRIDYRPWTPDGEPDEPWQTYDTVPRGTESATIDGLRHGEKYDIRVVAVTEHTETEDI